MSLPIRPFGSPEKRCREEEMKRPPGFFECSDVWGEVVQFLSVEDTNRIAQTCHMLSERIFDVKSGSLREHAFGAYKWEHYLGQVERISLPLKLFDILESPCPFEPEKKIKETHILFYLPQRVDGEPLTLNRLGELVENPKEGSGGHPTRYDCFSPAIEGAYEDESTDAPRWVLMTRNVIPGSRNKSFKAQCELIPLTQGYEVPKALEVAVGIFLRFVETGERLFSDAPRTYTRCQEQVEDDDYRFVVGGFGSSGLCVSRYYRDREFYGIAALRKFSGPDKQVKQHASACCSLQ